MIIENSRLWVGPLCSRLGMRRSISGRMDRAHIIGMFSALSRFCILASRYPIAMWPAAYIFVRLFS